MSAGVHPPPGPPPPRRHHRALAQGAGLQVQLRQDDLPEVLRASAAAGDQLPEEEVRAHEPAAPEEEAEVNGFACDGRGVGSGVSLLLCGFGGWTQGLRGSLRR